MLIKLRWWICFFEWSQNFLQCSSFKPSSSFLKYNDSSSPVACNNLLVTKRLCPSKMSPLYSSIGIRSFLPRKFTVRLDTSTIKDRNEMKNDKVRAIVRRIRRIQRCDHLSPILTPYQPSGVNYYSSDEWCTLLRSFWHTICCNGLSIALVPLSLVLVVCLFVCFLL